MSWNKTSSALKWVAPITVGIVLASIPLWGAPGDGDNADEPMWPHVIPYEGVLTIDGESFSGAQAIEFNLYESNDPAAEPIWTETQNAHFLSGRFSVLLGQSVGIEEAIIEANHLYIGLAVQNDDGAFVPLAGRQRIVPAPYALWARGGTNFQLGDLHVNQSYDPALYVENPPSPEATRHAQIANDTTNYKSLMLLGNRTSGDEQRKISMWDDVKVSGTLSAVNVSASQEVTARNLRAKYLNLDNAAITSSGSITANSVTVSSVTASGAVVAGSVFADDGEFDTQIAVGGASGPARLEVRNGYRDGFTGGSGSSTFAEIANETTSYKSLMILGNKSAGGSRQVSVWDDLTVRGDLTVEGSLNGFLHVSDDSEAIAVCASSQTVYSATQAKTLTPTESSMCFLSYQYTSNGPVFPAKKIQNYCRIDSTGGNWTLTAYCKTDQASDVARTQCRARCLEWN